jgi:hypothetical protein
VTIPWIFDDDEHFLKACGITPYPEYQDDCLLKEAERTKQIMKTLLNEFGPELDYFDENPNEDPFGYDMNAHPDLGEPLQTEQDIKDEELYRLEVQADLATAISEFLSFSTKEQLLKFVNDQLN